MAGEAIRRKTQTTMDPLPADEIRVSVIVPAFNMELFIEQCLRSLFDQTLDRLEVIVVDDGSTDRTREVVESLTPPEGKSLRVITKPNGGLSSARNAGMKAAQGRWIGFVDADDWVAGAMYSVLFSEAERVGADLAIARGMRVDTASSDETTSLDIGGWSELIAAHGSSINPHDCPDIFVLDHSPCKRLYRRAFLKKIRFSFADGLIFEDVLANYQILLRAKLSVLVNKPLYFYRVGRQGQITGRKDHTVLDILPVLNMILDELWNQSASDELWANFICVQGWYMLWLCAQISDEHRELLALGAARMARRFPPRGLARFREKFGREPRLTTAVDLELYGNASLLAEFAQTQVASERARKVTASDTLRRFFTARAQVTSRLARLSARRRLRQSS